MPNYNDISITDTSRGGDIEFAKNDIILTAGLRNNVYLSLFGGNVEQTSDRVFNTGEQRADWWGNSLLWPNDPDKQLNSRTEKALQDYSASSAGRAMISQALLTDLKALRQVGAIASEVTLEALDRTKLAISITERESGATTELEYLWDASLEDEIAREFREADPTPPDQPVERNAFVDGQLNDFIDGQQNKFITNG